MGGAKSAAPGSSKLVLAAKPAAPGPRKSSAGAKAAASSAGKSPSGEPNKGRKVPSPARAGEEGVRVADFNTDISVSDYLGGKFFLTNIKVHGLKWGNCLLSRLRWRPLRRRRRMGRRVFCRTRGPPFARAARYPRLPLLRKWRAPCPSS
jgi:hypothetical protein